VKGALDGGYYLYSVSALPLIVIIYFIVLKTQKIGGMINIFLFFELLFFIIVPSRDLTYGIGYWGEDYPDQTVLMYVNLLIVSATLTVYLFWSIGSRKVIFIKELVIVKRYGLIYLTLLSFFSILIVLYVYDFNIGQMLFRKYSTFANSGNERYFHLIINYIVRPTILLSLMFALYFFRKSKMVWLSILLISFFSLLGLFPTSVPRFIVGTLYFAVVALIIKKISPTGLSNLFIFGYISTFSLIGSFRNLESFSNFMLVFKMSASGAYDTYFNFSHVINQEIVTFGHQLLGVLLFFIPRSIYTDKAVGSGTLLADRADFVFSNISMAFLGEGYINFGLAGIFIFASMLGYLLGYWDKKFSIYRQKNISSNFMIFYLMMLPLLFFLLRGDLMTAFSFFCSLLFAYKLVSFLILRRIPISSSFSTPKN